MDDFGRTRYDDPDICAQILQALMTRAITQDPLFNIGSQMVMQIHGPKKWVGIMSIAFDKLKENAIEGFDLNADKIREIENKRNG